MVIDAFGCFLDLQRQLQESTKLNHCNMEKTLCVHMGALDRYWTVCATQCSPIKLTKSLQLQAHEPLAFLRGAFTEREAHCFTYERRVFAVVQAFNKLYYLLACDDSVRICTDHRNLLFAINPIAMESSLGRHKVLKLVRPALYLSGFNH